MKIDVLDKGFVELIDVMGDDLTVVNSAKVSFAKGATEMDERAERLVGYLADHKHTSPFRSAQLMLRFKAPLFCARQIWKHIVGVSIDFDDEMNIISAHNGIKDVQWNEQSGRYVELEEEFYVPATWRKQSVNNKQGSDGVFDGLDHDTFALAYDEAINSSYQTYKQMVDAGVAKEQARIMLPVSIYTQWIATMSLQAAYHLIDLRCKKDAQFETRQYGLAVLEIVKGNFPVATKAWSKSRGWEDAFS